MNDNILESKHLPENYSYPEPLLRIINLNLLNLEPWHIPKSKRLEWRIVGLKERYPGRILIPFAERYDNDDVACFEVGKGIKVQIIHDFASVGYEQRHEYPDFWSWFKEAVDEMISFE